MGNIKTKIAMYNLKKINIHQERKRLIEEKGSILILALVLASILLSVGMGISGIAMKEIRLSSIGNESGKAFYMADTGAECALYWDSRPAAMIEDITGGTGNVRQSIFPTSTASLSYIATPNSDIKCFNGVDITDPTPAGAYQRIETDNNPDSATTTFELKDPGDITKPCAIVQVAKHDTGGGNFFTTINSYGRSSCDENNLRRVERGLKVSY